MVKAGKREPVALGAARREFGHRGGWLIAGVVAVAAAVAGAVLWQRNRRRPVSRSARAWRAVTDRFGR